MIEINLQTEEGEAVEMVESPAFHLRPGVKVEQVVRLELGQVRVERQSFFFPVLKK